MNKRMIVLAAWLVTAGASANPFDDFIQNESLKLVNKVEGNVATGSLDNTNMNATAVADGDNSYAVAGGVISHNNSTGVRNGKKRADVTLDSAQIDANAEAANGNKAFAGVYVNQ